MRPLLIPLPGNEQFASVLGPQINAEIGKVRIRHFPDGETYLRYDTPVAGRSIALLCTLNCPDKKFLPLLFAAAAARDLQAERVGLIAPYLAYMRQDHRFEPGEAITSNYFAKTLSAAIDWLVTVDPHLHRHTSLTEIYDIPTRVVHAAAAISDWIRINVDKPLLIGPDSESEQWVAAVAHSAGAPHLVLEKHRRGDHDVDVSVPDVVRWRDYTPVLVDDIASTAHTMIETLGHLKRAHMRPSICIAVHGIFAETAFDDLTRAGASKIVTTNTIPHISNEIGIGSILAKGVNELIS